MPGREPPADPDRFEEAVRAFRQRVPMTDEEFDALSQDEREFAFKVAGVAQADIVQDVFDAIDRAVTDGTTLEDFKDEVGDQLTDAWGEEDGFRVETIFRTNVLQSYNAGRYAVMTAPAVKDARPYWRFDAVGDSRDCPICEPLNGTVLPADDPFWKKNYVPRHPNCRCQVTPLSPEEAEDEGIDDEAPEAEPPADGFGTPPSSEGSDWEPDPGDYDPAIRGEVEQRLK